MRSRRNVLLLVLSLVALVSLTGAPSAVAAGPYSMTISSAATSGSMYCNAYQCYPTASDANLNVSDLVSHMDAASLDGYSNFDIGDNGSGQTGTITIENSIDEPSMLLTLSPDSGNVVIDDTTDAGDTATIDTNGLTIYSGISGPATGSSSLTVSGGQLTLYGGTTGSTLGSLDFEDGAELAASSNTLNANSITVTGDLAGDGDGSNTVTFDAPDGTTLDPGSFGYAGIDSMTVDGPARVAGTFDSDGNDETQTYEGAVTLIGNTTIGAHTTFDSTIDGAYGLTVSGSATLDGAVGSLTQLQSLTVTGATTIDTTSVSTVNGQSYGATTLTASPALSGSNIAFNSTLDGAQSLTVYDTGQALFGGAVGGSTPLTALTLSSGAGNAVLSGSVTTSGSQSYSQPVALDAPLTLSAPGSTIDFADALGSSDTLTLANGTLELNSAGNTLSGGGVQINSGATADFVAGALATGTVTLNGGTLAWDSANTSAPNAIDVNSSGGTLNVGGNNVTLSSGTGGSNAGTVIKSGAGELTLAAGSGASYGALVEVASGPLRVTGSIVTPVTVDSGTTLVCDGGTLGGAVTNSGGTLTGAPSEPTSVAATGDDGAISVAFTPGSNSCYPVNYTANEVGASASASGTASPLTFSGLTLGRSYNFTVTETNPLGSATASSNTLFLPVAPTVSITSPVQGASYTEGQVVDAAYSCTEASGGPGIASCTGTVASGAALDTSIVGTHTLTVTATSLDGESMALGYTYTVTAPPSPPTTTTTPPTTTTTTPPLTTTAPPSNAFTVKTLTGAASGALKLTLVLPGAGSVKVTETVAGVGTVATTARESHAGTCKLTTALSKKLQAKLRRRHVKHVTVKIAFTASGGGTRTISRTVSL
jgi:mucin-19